MVDLVESYLSFVMAGLVPAIHEKKDVDPRDKPGDDGWGMIELGRIPH